MKPLAIICNILLPGLGTLIIGRYLLALLQWAIWAFGVFLSSSIILAILGFPFIAAGWLWALITTINYQDPAHQPQPQSFRSKLEP